MPTVVPLASASSQARATASVRSASAGVQTTRDLSPARAASRNRAIEPSNGCCELRASMGSIFRVPLSGFDEPAGRRIALVPRGGDLLTRVNLTGEVVFVLGAEREGLPDKVVASCDAAATIPLAGGAESLNVAMAGTVALYELARRTSA